MDQVLSAVEESLLASAGGKDVDRRPRRRTGVRTVKLDDRHVRILPRYHRRRRVVYDDWTPSARCGDDVPLGILNGSVVCEDWTPSARCGDDVLLRVLSGSVMCEDWTPSARCGDDVLLRVLNGSVMCGDWTPNARCGDDVLLGVLNGSVVRSTAAAERWRHAARRTRDSVGPPTRASDQHTDVHKRLFYV